VGALLKSAGALNAIAEGRLDSLLKNYPPSVHEAAKPLVARLVAEKNARSERLKKLESLLTASGDVGRGRKVFFGKRAACSGCHTMGAEGGHVGPDLTAIGKIRSAHDLLEAIVYPSASFVPGHEVYRVKVGNEIQSGVIAEQTPDAIVLVTGPNAELRIRRDQIASMEPSTVSLMPDGLETTLSHDELKDLLAFLRAQP
jgi:putative heme-binding domain-containing protein